MTTWNEAVATNCLPKTLAEGRGIAVAVRSGVGLGDEAEWHFGGLAFDEGAQFEIGSLTKVFTAALLLKMANAGVVGLRDRLGRWFPAVLPAGANVTLADLATHRSGLPRLAAGISGLDANPYAQCAAERLERWMAGYGWRTAGESAYRYSNLGYAVLGLALERAAGAGYAWLLARHVLEPYGLKNTWIAGPGSAQPNRLPGYTEAGFRTRPWEWQAYAPCGGLLSTATDVGRFLGGLVTDPSMRGLFEPIADTPLGPIGLGWMLRRPSPHEQDDELSGAGAVRSAWHNGATYGFSSYAGLDLETGKWMALLANRYTPQATAGARRMERVFFLGIAPGNRPVEKRFAGWAREARLRPARLVMPFPGLPFWAQMLVAGGMVWFVGWLLRWVGALVWKP